MAKTGKRMYCPECKKNRTWMSAYKKQQMEPGEKPYDFRFFVCQTCEYAYDPKTGLEIPNWRERYYSAESFDAEDLYELPATELIDLFYSMRNALLRDAGEDVPEYNEEEYYALMDEAPSVIIAEINEMEKSKIPSNITKYIDIETFEADDDDGFKPTNWNKIYGCKYCGDSWCDYLDGSGLCPVKHSDQMDAETFEAVVVQRRKPKGIVDKILMQQDMMMRARLQELDMRLDTDVRLGIISEEQADMIMMKNLMNMGLLPDDFEAEEWDDVNWSDPPSEVPRGLDLTWGDDVEWKNQAEKALDYFMDLAEGSAATELESRFILSPRHFAQFMARLGPEQRKYIDTIEGFGEGPYPVALSILTPAEIITQTELQLHTIFEAFEAVLEGAPDEHDDHDHDDHDHDDHDHDEFETILTDYFPYQPERYRVHVRTAEGIKMMGEYTNLAAAQELADDWNAPGYGKPVARIERLRARNGAFRGLSRVMFDDGSYLTFVLMGDLTYRDSEFVDMTSFFVFPSTFAADNNWWESQRNN